MEKEQIRIKLEHPNAKVPTFAYDGESAGADLVAVSCTYNKEYDFYEYDTGIAIELKPNQTSLVCPNSRLTKTKFYLPNSPGVVDPGYRGTIKLRYKTTVSNLWKAFKLAVKTAIKDRKNFDINNILNSSGPFNVGDVVGQLLIVNTVPCEFIVSDKLTESKRNKGAYGSSKNKNN